MTIRQKPRQRGNRQRFSHGDRAVLYTEAWEHETFAEEQARWERSDPDYARICEAVRRAKGGGEEASRRADEAKAECDARVATERQTNDEAQRAHHLIRAREAQHHNYKTFAIESNDSPAPGIMPERVRVHDQSAARNRPLGERQAAGLRVRGPATRNLVGNEPIKLEVE